MITMKLIKLAAIPVIALAAGITLTACDSSVKGSSGQARRYRYRYTHGVSQARSGQDNSFG